MTAAAVDGGHIAGQPLELILGVDLRDEETCTQLLHAVRNFKPWLVIAEFPCAPWSPLQNLHKARFSERIARDRQEDLVFLYLVRDVFRLQAQGNRLAVAENPWRSAAWAEEPLADLQNEGYELVCGDQCCWGLRSELDSELQGHAVYHRKSTGFLVTRDSALGALLSRKCPGKHTHAPIVGHGLGAKSAIYPTSLARTFITAAVQELAMREVKRIHTLFHDNGNVRYDGAQAQMLDEAGSASIAHTLMLSPSAVEVNELGSSVTIPVLPRYYSRRIAVMISRTGELVHFEDSWDRAAN